MSSTPSSPMEIRANGQLVARIPNAVGTDRRTPLKVRAFATLVDATGPYRVEPICGSHVPVHRVCCNPSSVLPVRVIGDEAKYWPGPPPELHRSHAGSIIRPVSTDTGKIEG